MKIAHLLVCICCTVAAIFAQNSSIDFVHYKLGMKYKSENKPEQAIEEFRKVLANFPDHYNAYLHLAEIRMQQKNYQLAIYNLQKALTYNPGWGKAHKLLAQVYVENEQYASALKELQKYQMVADPAEAQQIQTQIDKVMRHLSVEKKQQEQKKEEIQRSIEQQSKTPAVEEKPVAKKRPARPDVESVFMKGVEQYKQRQFDESLATMRRVLSLQKAHPGAYYYAGLIRRRNGQDEMARINFLNSLSYPELGYNAHFYLGKIYGEKKQYAEAIKHLRQYIAQTDYEQGKKDGQWLIDKYTAAMDRDPTLLQDDATPQKEERLEKIIPRKVGENFFMQNDSLLALSIVDTLSDAGNAMLEAIQHYRNGMFEKAIEGFKQAMAQYPTANVIATCLYNIGLCYTNLRLPKDAEANFASVLRRYSTHSLAPRSSFLAALSWFYRADYATSEKLFRDFIRSHRSHQWTAMAYQFLGDSYRQLDQPRKALEAYSQAVERLIDPDQKTNALFKQSELYFQLDNPKRAAAIWKKIIEQEDSNKNGVRLADSYYRLADYTFKQGQSATAMQLYKKATRAFVSHPENAWGLFQIGTLYQKQGQFKKAIDSYKLLMQKYPEDYWARQAKWKMQDAIWEDEYKEVLN